MLSAASVSGSCWSSEVKTPTQTWSRWSIGGSDGVPQTQTLTPLSLEPAESLKSVKTFSRPADGRRMKRDHPNCWTAQLNTIVKTFSCVCVCEQYRWSGLTLIINPQLSHPESRWCGTIQPVSGFICSTSFSPRSADDVIHQNLLYKKTEFFSPVRKRETQVFLCSKVQRTERSAASWEVSCFNCSVFIQCIKNEAWGTQEYWKKSWNMTKIDRFWWKWTQVWLFRTGKDVQTPTCMNILSIYQYIHQ